LKQEKRRRKIAVAIVDDDPDVVEDLKGYVELTDGVECVYATTNPKEALIALRTLKLDVLFLDIEMPIVGGLDILGTVRKENGKRLFLQTAVERFKRAYWRL